MAFFDFDFIENFFFISLGITFALIVLLVYHFKQRITSMERKGDTMYELITNVVKELQFMKKLNAYYETLFQNTALSVDDNPAKERVNNEGVTVQKVDVKGMSDDGLLSKNNVLGKDSVVSPTNNIIMNLNDKPPQPKESHINSRIVVSDDESSVSDEGEDSDSDETDLNYSSSDDDSEDEYNEIDEKTKNEEPITTAITFEDKSSSVIPRTPTFVPHYGVLTNQTQLVGEIVSVIPIEEDLSSSNDNNKSLQQSPVEMNHLMEMIQKAFTTGIVRQEPQKFAPYYEDEMSQTNTYKPVILNYDDQHEDEPIVDVLDIVQTTIGEPNDIVKNVGLLESADARGVPGITGDGLPSNVIESEMVELDISGLEDFSQHPEQILSNDNVLENIVEPITLEDKSSSVIPLTPTFVTDYDVLTIQSPEQEQPPVPSIDKKQTREVYRKMNITQLRGIATAAGINVDTTKMKKNELIQLLENLEE